MTPTNLKPVNARHRTNKRPTQRLAAALLGLALTGAATLAVAEDEDHPRGRDEAPGAPVACMEAARTALSNPATFKWIGPHKRKVAEDAYSITAQVEYGPAGAAPKVVSVQCDVLRAPGDQFVVAKLRLPATQR